MGEQRELFRDPDSKCHMTHRVILRAEGPKDLASRFFGRLRRPQNDKRRAFTLIELMIVVIIIAALAAMIVPRLSGRADQAKVTVAQTDISANIATALKLYQLDNGNFPTTEQGLSALLDRPTSESAGANWNGPYLEKKPVDPWGNPYKYRYPGANNKSSYDLYSVGKDGSEGTEDDVTNWSK